uniref:Cysteine-rich protein n=1 Tax=Spironucleus salmonicida TaxID=348837 RepID=V6LLB3_9EUKA|eukprot:EST44526.1 Hypothetical protein SS50377_15524 [Spironucleus salmonicida]
MEFLTISSGIIPILQRIQVMQQNQYSEFMLKLYGIFQQDEVSGQCCRTCKSIKESQDKYAVYWYLLTKLFYSCQNNCQLCQSFTFCYKYNQSKVTRIDGKCENKCLNLKDGQYCKNWMPTSCDNATIFDCECFGKVTVRLMIQLLQIQNLHTRWCTKF